MAAYHRPYIRKHVREEVERNAEKTKDGKFKDANTKEPIEGKYDLGHKTGHEFWREAEKAEREGLTQEEFNNRMNDPNLYQIEDPHENRSHAHEMPKSNVNDFAKEKSVDEKSSSVKETESNGNINGSSEPAHTDEAASGGNDKNSSGSGSGKGSEEESEDEDEDGMGM